MFPLFSIHVDLWLIFSNVHAIPQQCTQRPPQGLVFSLAQDLVPRTWALQLRWRLGSPNLGMGFYTLSMLAMKPISYSLTVL